MAWSNDDHGKRKTRNAVRKRNAMPRYAALLALPRGSEGRVDKKWFRREHGGSAMIHGSL